MWDWDKLSSDHISTVVLTASEILRQLLTAGRGDVALQPRFQYALALALPNKKKARSFLEVSLDVTWPAELHALAPQQRQAWFQNAGSARVKTVLQHWGIKPSFFNDLFSLDRFDFAMVLDDSGSMASRISGTHKTRWDELKEITRIAVEIAGALDSDGMEINFLNRSGLKGVSTWEQAERLFRSPPSGSTPLTEATQRAFASLKPNKPLLVMIATDGVPDNLASFTNLLARRDVSRIYVSILACSDNDRDVGYLNKLDREIQNLGTAVVVVVVAAAAAPFLILADVLDDYQSELKEVQRRMGPAVPYSMGDHVARYLLGAVRSPWNLRGGRKDSHMRADLPRLRVSFGHARLILFRSLTRTNARSTLDGN